MPNGTAWPVVAFGGQPRRRHPRAAQHVPPSARARGAAADRGRRAPRAAGRSSAGATTSPTSWRSRPSWSPARSSWSMRVPRLRTITVWEERRPRGRRAAAPRARRRARRRRCGRPTTSPIVFTSGSRGTPKGVIHTHGGALAATAAGLEVRRLTRDDRLYIPMPFFWVGGFGTGLLSALVAGATLLTEARPEPERTLPFLDTRAGHALPRLARPGRRARARPRLRRRRPLVAASGQPRRGDARRASGRARAARRAARA